MKKWNILKLHKRISSVLKTRFSQYQPQMIRFTLFVVLFVAIFISLSVYLHPEGMRYSFHFYLDTGSITILSTSFLMIASILSFSSFLRNRSEDKRLKVFFLLICLSFLYLVLDEAFMLHENIGDSIDKTGFLKDIFRKTQIRRWNDLIIILYGLLALPLIIYFLPSMSKVPYLIEFFIIAFLCYAAHTTIDSVIEPATTPSYILEESAKLFASTFLVLGTYAGYQYFYGKQE